MALSPNWANLPRRFCDDCGKKYKPIVPIREGERGFCSPNCRKSYHKHGGAYRKLRGEMRKMLDRQMEELEKKFREIARQELQRARISAPVADSPDYLVIEPGPIGGRLQNNPPRSPAIR